MTTTQSTPGLRTGEERRLNAQASKAGLLLMKNSDGTYALSGPSIGSPHPDLPGATLVEVAAGIEATCARHRAIREAGQDDPEVLKMVDELTHCRDRGEDLRSDLVHAFTPAAVDRMMAGSRRRRDGWPSADDIEASFGTGT
jgi:hypothetical protein